MENRIINGWKILNKISEGSFGTVYKATKDDGSICAIKHIGLPKLKHEADKLIRNGIVNNYQEADNYFMDAITKEVEIMNKLVDSPNIVNCYGTYQEYKHDGSGIDCYIMMEYVEDLNTYYANHEIVIDDVIKLGIDICSALDLCSSINIIHSDIKPENIFIGSDGRYKLGDFGAAFYGNEVNSKSLATLNYVAPEIYKNNKATKSSDLYSLGLVMYQIVNGKLPFISKEINEKGALNNRMSGKKLPAVRGIKKNFMDIILKACSFDEKNRYNSAIEMKLDLERLPHINSKKLKIDFSLNTKYSSTVDINDERLTKNNYANNINIDNLKKLDTKTIVILLIILVIVILGVVSCSLNKKCDDGYINKNGTCVKGYYYCDAGYSLNADNKCQKTTESIEAKVSYECPKNYTLNGDVCVSNEVKEPHFVYKCADGFTLKGTKCEKVETADAIITYECPSGYVAAGDQCVTINNISATEKYTCSGNGVLNGNVCNYQESPTYGYGMMPKCSKGNYNYRSRVCEYSENATKVYECPNDYVLVGNQCSKNTSVKGTPKYVCADGTTLRNNKCYGTISTDAVGMYECPAGYIANGLTCIQENLPAPTKKYSCSKVYTLNGDQCEKYEIVSPNAFYYDK